MTPRKNDPAGNRTRIVSAAFELFTTAGYGPTTMLEVRDLAGISSGALAHHFPSKHALGMAVLREPLAAAIEETWIKPVENAPDTYSGVSAVFQSTIAGIDHAGVVAGCPLGNLAAELSARDGTFRNELNGLYERWARAIAKRLDQDIASLPQGGEPHGQLPGFIVAAFSGAILMAKASQDAAPLRSCWSQLGPMLKTRSQSS